MKHKPLKFEVVRKTGGDIDVVTQIKKNGHWYTAATCFAVVGHNNAQEIAEFIAESLNCREQLTSITMSLAMNQQRRVPRFAN